MTVLLPEAQASGSAALQCSAVFVTVDIPTQIEIWLLQEHGQYSQAKDLIADQEKKLKTGAPVSIVVGGTASGPRRVTLDNNVEGLWKNLKAPYTDGVAEVFAYQLDLMLDAHIVPITVYRELDGKMGSFQLIVKGQDISALKYHYGPLYLKWFDFLLDNRDRRNNYLTVNGRVVAFDHSLTLEHPDTIQRTLDKIDYPKVISQIISPYLVQREKVEELQRRLGQTADAAESYELQQEIQALNHLHSATMSELAIALPEERIYNRLKDISDADWKTFLRSYLSESQMNHFFARKRSLLEAIDEVLRVFGRQSFRSGSTSPLVRY